MRLTTLPILMMLAGCGPVGPLDSGAADDFGDAFLYFINANPGAEKMVFRGAHRKIANLRFGERSYVDGVCGPEQVCVPDLVDRSDGVFKVKFDGERSEVDLSSELAAMYPQETGTVVVTGPSRGIVLRHPQSVSSSCAISVVNGLAVDDLATDRSAYDIAIEIRTTADHGYADEAQIPIITACGALPTDTAAQLAIARTELLENIAEQPWFAPIPCGDGATGDCLAWGIPSTDSRTAFDGDGTFLAAPDTASYFGCVEAAITTPVECGDALTWDDVAVDWGAVESCAQAVRLRTELAPLQGLVRLVDDRFCDVEFRVRTPERDLIFGANEGDSLGSHGDGELIGDTLTDSPQGSETFWLLYGRPVNPRVWRWIGSDLFVDLKSYPYP